MALLQIALLLLAGLVLALAGRATLDRRADRAEWARLAALQPAAPPAFDPAMVTDLPEPARRYFGFAIRPGTPLRRVAEIEMQGSFGLGDKAQPRSQPMAARQILAAPEGFLWAMRTRGVIPVSGSDTGRWTRFRMDMTHDLVESMIGQLGQEVANLGQQLLGWSLASVASLIESCAYCLAARTSASFRRTSESVVREATSSAIGCRRARIFPSSHAARLR